MTTHFQHANTDVIIYMTFVKVEVPIILSRSFSVKLTVNNAYIRERVSFILFVYYANIKVFHFFYFSLIFIYLYVSFLFICN